MIRAELSLFVCGGLTEVDIPGKEVAVNVDRCAF